jgi:hypothetical protein
MKMHPNSLRSAAAALVLAASSLSANAALTVTVTKLTDTEITFQITGDLTGVVPPASDKQALLYLVPTGTTGASLSNWLPSGTFDGSSPSPTGTVDVYKTVAGWAFIADDASTSFRFNGADSYAIMFSAPLTTSSVVTQPITLDRAGLTLNNADVAGFAVYWGDQMAGSTVPEPSAAILCGVAGLLALRRRRR